VVSLNRLELFMSAAAARFGVERPGKSDRSEAVERPAPLLPGIPTMTIDQQAWVEGACDLSPSDEFEIGIRSDLALAIKPLGGVLAIVDDQQSGLKGEAQRDSVENTNGTLSAVTSRSGAQPSTRASGSMRRRNYDRELLPYTMNRLTHHIAREICYPLITPIVICLSP
jgi:hypothetical protein